MVLWTIPDATVVTLANGQKPSQAERSIEWMGYDFLVKANIKALLLYVVVVFLEIDGY